MQTAGKRLQIARRTKATCDLHDGNEGRPCPRARLACDPLLAAALNQFTE
jgi:hypothetical protein